jgi:hypothetical protein
MYKTLASLLIAGSAVYAAEADPMADVCDRLVAALEQETAALESITSAESVPAGVVQLRASLDNLQELMSVDSKELWLYIDNTDGVKQPIIDALEALALQFARMEKEDFFGSEELRGILAPQALETDDTEAARHAKREKLREIDHDED